MTSNKCTALLLNWKRPDNLVKVIESIRKQTVPTTIFLWDNSGEDIKYDVDAHVRSNINFKCWPRWALGSMAESEFIFSLDDDLMFKDEKVLEDACKYRTVPDIIIGYCGVQLVRDTNYWDSPHIKAPREEDTYVDIVKGRFMFMRRNFLKSVGMEYEPTCDDIRLSSRSKCKVIPGMFYDRFIELDEGSVALWQTAEQQEKRNKARFRYFSRNQSALSDFAE